MNDEILNQLAAVRAGILKIGTPWTGPTAAATHDIYNEVYSRLGATFASTKVVRDVKYGPAERKALDVYLPPRLKEGAAVIAFFHGGGFFAGDKQWTQHVYSNIGHFFASNGIVTVLANHQLVPEASGDVEGILWDG